MPRNPFLTAALAAADRGWNAFPVIPGGKAPAINRWEEHATTDGRHLYRWWAGSSKKNIGVAVGKSGLVVVDLDGGRGDTPPERFAGARNGWEVLAMLAAEAGAEPPTDTYTVASPRGCHLYFRAPVALTLRNTVGSLGWRIDTRSHGGFIVAAGSMRSEGSYRVTRAGEIAELPKWLVKALTPPPLPAMRPMELTPTRANRYVRAIVEGEAHSVAAAEVGTRHHALLKAARTLGRLVGGRELTLDDARGALLDAAAGHVGLEGCTAAEVRQTIEDGIAYGTRLPRHIGRGHLAVVDDSLARKRPGPAR